MTLKNMPIIGRLLLGFALMLVLASLMGGLALYNIRLLAGFSEHMYRHPLAVINNIHSAKEGILSVRQEMNHLLHASPKETEEIKNTVEDYETRIANNLRVIRSQYLGPIDDVDAIDGMLASWWYDRAEVFQLTENGNRKAAFTLLHETDAKRAPLLDERIARIQNFAINRAAWINQEASLTRDNMTLATLLLLGVLLLSGGIAAWLITRGIVRPLDRLREAMIRLARGDLSTEVPHTGLTTEVGEMARTVATFKEEGIKSEGLRWVRSNVGELSASMRVANSMEELAEQLLNRLMTLVHGASGCFYVYHPDTERLNAIAFFARVSGAPSSFGHGEGCVGQCAAERRPIFLHDLPPERYALATGMGTALPACVVAYPVIWADQLLGVIEIATFRTFDESGLALLDALMPAVGVNMEVLARNLRTRELLEQTQRQAEALRASEEELQAQSEELRESNELMQRQTEQLRSSEEELRVQSEELQNSYDELSKKNTLVMEREHALEEARKVAEKRAVELDMASRYKSEFLANMSHELRTPLNSMLILAQTLAANEEGNLIEDQIESARIIHEGGTHLLSLINDILDLSKIEAGKLELLPEDIPVEEVRQSLERRFRHMGQAKGVVFSATLDAAVPAGFRADRRKVDQILSNLVGNALKFTERGEVAVTFSRPGETTLAIAIRDSGVGIATAKLDKIFDAFEQADGSTSRRFGGTGLGLAISRKLARLMGGDITVSSEEGVGSTFTLSLPLLAVAVPRSPTETPADVTRPASPPAPAANVSQPALMPTPGEAFLLVIEDDPAFSRIVCDLARKKGFKCIAAADGEEGLALAARHQPTGVILDVGLPGQDGWSVMERLKRDPATSKIPVHFMSAFDESLRGLGMGAVGFFVKPVTKEQIEGAFEKINRFAAHAPQKVLVLDKDDSARQTVSELIGNRNITILEAQSCADALHVLRTDNIDCLIFDLGFPDAGDLEFLEKVSTEKGAAMPPLVIYSDRELDEEEVIKLRSYTDSIIIKGQRSPERLLDEVSLFLHRVSSGLPDERHAAPVEVEESSGETNQLTGHKVLVVDDDMRNTFALSKVLRSKGMKVLMAQDGDKALAQLAGNPDMDLVLMDIMMPGKDGYQTTREIREIPEWQNIPIIALTARAMPGDREKCLDAGASDYLTKPVDIDKLLSMMRVWLKGNA